MPKVKFPIKDIKGITIFNRFGDECTSCEGYIKNGELGCDNVVKIPCKSLNEKTLFTLDVDNYSKVDAYIKYLFERCTE